MIVLAAAYALIGAVAIGMALVTVVLAAHVLLEAWTTHSVTERRRLVTHAGEGLRLVGGFLVLAVACALGAIASLVS